MTRELKGKFVVNLSNLLFSFDGKIVELKYCFLKHKPEVVVSDKNKNRLMS